MGRENLCNDFVATYIWAQCGEKIVRAGEEMDGVIKTEQGDYFQLEFRGICVSLCVCVRARASACVGR